MDLVFVGIAAVCLLLAGRRRSLFLWLVLAEFGISMSWMLLPVGDPWWFFAYAGQNCLFVCLVMLTRHRLAREYAGTLIASALIATLVFIEFYTGGATIHGARPVLMACICTYQLWLAATGAGLMEGTPLEAARGIAARRTGRRRGAGAHNPARSVGGRL